MVRFRDDWLNQINIMQREMEQLLDHISRKPPAVQFSPRVWQPAIDVYETDSELVVVVELAGVNEDDMEIVVDGDTFIIRGERRTTRVSSRCTYYQMEVSSGRFERTITLPLAVDPTKARASYQGGLVEVIIPKMRRIPPHSLRTRG